MTNKCRLTDGDLFKCFTWEKFPVFAGCVDLGIDKKTDILQDMNWYISDKGCIQIFPLPTLDEVYQNNHNDSVGVTWNKHHKEFAEFIETYTPKNVLEIGGASGILSEIYSKKNETKWTIIEPNPLKLDYFPANIIKKFFYSEDLKDEYDCIIHSHLFEHLQYPKIFMEQLSKIREGTFHIFSIPNQRISLNKQYSNCLFFEHSFLAHEDYVDTLLRNNGFKIIEKKYYSEHSIFYATVKDNSENVLQEYINLHDVNKKLLYTYNANLQRFVYKINKTISFNQETYIFGAHVFTQVLLNKGLDSSKLRGIIDNSTAKIGKRLYGTNLEVYSPNILNGDREINIILDAGNYMQEIYSQLRSLNNNITFIVKEII